MSHFGVLSYRGTGHLNAMSALSRHLLLRGHRVTCFERPDLQSHVLSRGIDFVPIGCIRQRREFSPLDSQSRSAPSLSDLRYRIRRIMEEIDMSLHEAPAALSRSRIDALLIDEITLPGPTLAQMLQLPYFIISTSVPHNFGWEVPHSLAHCGNKLAGLPRLYKSLLQISNLQMRGPVRWHLNRKRRQLNLAPVLNLPRDYPPLAHIATLPACLDFPRASLPHNFHYTGPFLDESAGYPVPFPWDSLDGRRLIYVSLGTARTVPQTTFRVIAEACSGLGHQVVISLGGSHSPEFLSDLPGEPLIVKEAPQREIIRLADVVINHGGINTVFETLSEGKPMVAIPIAHDQPALAARLSWLQVAEVIPHNDLSAKRLRAAIVTVLNTPSYRHTAHELQTQILAARGLDRAVTIIEEALGSNISTAQTLSYAYE